MKPYRIFPIKCPNCGGDLPIWDCVSEVYESDNSEYVCNYACSFCKENIQVVTTPSIAAGSIKSISTSNTSVYNSTTMNNVNSIDLTNYRVSANDNSNFGDVQKEPQVVKQVDSVNTIVNNTEDFSYISIKCTNCGNEQNVQSNKEKSVCRYCNQEYVVSDARRLFLQKDLEKNISDDLPSAPIREGETKSEDFVLRTAKPSLSQTDSKVTHGFESEYSSPEQVYSNRNKYSQAKTPVEKVESKTQVKREKQPKVKYEPVYDDEPRWVVAKLIIGIISILLFMVVSFQSCAAGLGNALTGNGEISGTFGFLCAVNFLIAGIVGLCIRKKGLGAHITVCVFYYIIYLLSAAGAGSYSDLKVWGFLGFIFGSVFLFSALRSKKGYIIGAVVAVLMLLICIPAMSSSSEANKENKAQNNITDMSVTSDVGGTEDKDLSIESTESVAEEVPNQEDISTQEEQVDATLPSIEEKTLLDNSGVIVKAVELTEDSIWGPAIKLYIENNSEKNVHVGCDALIVNDYMITDLFSSSVAAGKKTYENLNLSSSGLKAAGIDNIGKIELYLRLYDDDTWEDIYKSDCITIETSEYANMDVTPNDAGKEILNQDGIRVVAKYVDEDTFWGKSILLYLENNSERNIHISVDNMSINGFMVDSIFSTEIYSGKKKIDDITLLSTKLEENGINSVDDVELTFKAHDSDYNDIFETSVSFSTH